MLQSRYIVVEDFPDDKSRVLYNGSSVIEAQKAMGQSVDKGEAQAVLFFSHPVHSQIRFPLQETIDRQERARRAELAKNAGVIAKRKDADAKRERAKALAAEAKRLDAEASVAQKELESKDNE